MNRRQYRRNDNQQHQRMKNTQQCAKVDARASQRFEHECVEKRKRQARGYLQRLRLALMQNDSRLCAATRYFGRRRGLQQQRLNRDVRSRYRTHRVDRGAEFGSRSRTATRNVPSGTLPDTHST